MLYKLLLGWYRSPSSLQTSSIKCCHLKFIMTALMTALLLRSLLVERSTVRTQHDDPGQDLAEPRLLDLVSSVLTIWPPCLLLAVASVEEINSMAVEQSDLLNLVIGPLTTLVVYTLCFIRTLFFWPRLSVLIFLSILGWKYSCEYS